MMMMHRQRERWVLLKRPRRDRDGHEAGFIIFCFSEGVNAEAGPIFNDFQLTSLEKPLTSLFLILVQLNVIQLSVGSQVSRE